MIGQLEGVGRPIVAVHAIHGAMIAARQFLLGGFGISGLEYDKFSIRTELSDLRNRLALFVRGNISDGRIGIEMPAVDADASLPSVTADFHHQDGGEGRIL